MARSITMCLSRPTSPGSTTKSLKRLAKRLQAVNAFGLARYL